MAVISIYTDCEEETGNTTTTLALGTYYGIIENKKTLIISTGFNENTMTEALWAPKSKRISGLFGPNTNMISQSGLEDLDRMIKSNRFSPETIPNYTRTALKSRLELLNGYSGEKEKFKSIEGDYVQIITNSKKMYNSILVDIDRNLSENTKKEILAASDIVIALTTQKQKNIENLVNMIQEEETLKKVNTIIAIGKYDDTSKYNIKNISRNILKTKQMVSTIPYNTIIFEAMQEGKMIDVFWSFLNLKSKDKNFFFIEEIRKLKEKIDMKEFELQLRA